MEIEKVICCSRNCRDIFMLHLCCTVCALLFFPYHRHFWSILLIEYAVQSCYPSDLSVRRAQYFIYCATLKKGAVSKIFWQVLVKGLLSTWQRQTRIGRKLWPGSHLSQKAATCWPLQSGRTYTLKVPVIQQIMRRREAWRGNGKWHVCKNPKLCCTKEVRAYCSVAWPALQNRVLFFSLSGMGFNSLICIQQTAKPRAHL